MDPSLSRFFRDARSERLSDAEKLSLKEELMDALQLSHRTFALVHLQLASVDSVSER